MSEAGRGAPAIALTIAGSDPSGGAGIQADLKTFQAFGVYGASVLTALTAQNTRGVFGVLPVPPDFVRAQAAAVLDDLDVRVIKIGMLGDVPTIEAVTEIVTGRPGCPVVLDPVIVAASGDPLLEAGAVDALRERLLPLATVATPNLHEAAILLGEEGATSDDELAAQAERLRRLGPDAVLAKGGRRSEAISATDALAMASGVERLETPRVAVDRPHGTGCTLASAIAAGLALGDDVGTAVRRAKSYVSDALERAVTTPIGGGSRPLVHAPHG